MLKVFTLLADFITYSLMGLNNESGIGKAVHFFIEDVSKIFVLLVIMIYLVAIPRAGLNTERLRNFLSGKKRFIGYILASVFGALTPFCSCSSIPLFLAFTSAGIPLGITMAFLITSPMINEVAVVLLGSILGVRFTVIYVFTGIIAGILGGMIIDLLKAERYLEPVGQKAVSIAHSGSSVSGGVQVRVKLTLKERHQFALSEVKEIFRRVWKWVLIGVGLGAGLHGFVPEQAITGLLGDGAWWTVPGAVVLGIPLYANASGVIPVAESLLAKGVPTGTTMAFMMSVVAASFPEFTMLRKVMKPKLLILFFCLLLLFFTLAGWLFNIIGV